MTEVRVVSGFEKCLSICSPSPCPRPHPLTRRSEDIYGIRDHQVVNQRHSLDSVEGGSQVTHCNNSERISTFPCFSKLKWFKIMSIYLFVWLHQFLVHHFLVAAFGIFDGLCGTWTLGFSMWDLILWPGIESGPPALGTQTLSYWTTGKVPAFKWFLKFIL